MFAIFALALVSVLCISAAEHNSATYTLSGDEIETLIERKFAEKERAYVEREQELKETVHGLKDRVKALETTCSNESGQRNNTKRFISEAFASTPIAFTACVSVPDLTSLGKEHTILFDQVITNLGSAYYPHLGVFIAPLKGVYVFHITAMASPGKEQYLDFVKDGLVVGKVFPDSLPGQMYANAAGTWTLEMDVQSEVFLRTSGPGEIHGNCYTTFSGFLLQELE